MLKAYDINKNEDLLKYSEFLVKLLLETDDSNPIYYINYCQILKRQNKLENDNINKLIELRDNCHDISTKIGCNLLIGNKTEVNILLNKLDKDTIDEFKKFPISIYM